MIIELVHILAPPEKRQEIGSALASCVGPIEVQAGCLGCRLFETSPKLGEYRLEVRWNTREDLIRHLQSGIFKQVLLLMELSEAAPALEFFEIVEIHGLDLVESSRLQLG